MAACHQRASCLLNSSRVGFQCLLHAWQIFGFYVDSPISHLYFGVLCRDYCHPSKSRPLTLCLSQELLLAREDRKTCSVFSSPVLVHWVSWGTRLSCWPLPIQEHTASQCIFPRCCLSEWLCFDCWDAPWGQIQAKSLINIQLTASVHILWVILL